MKNLGSNHSTLTVTSDISGASNQSTRIDVSISLNKSNKSSEGNASPNCVPLTSNISDKYVLFALIITNSSTSGSNYHSGINI